MFKLTKLFFIATLLIAGTGRGMESYKSLMEKMKELDISSHTEMVKKNNPSLSEMMKGFVISNSKKRKTIGDSKDPKRTKFEDWTKLLWKSLLKRDFYGVDVAIQNGADVNAGNRLGETPISAACSFGSESGDWRIFYYLIGHGAVVTDDIKRRYSPHISKAISQMPQAAQTLGLFYTNKHAFVKMHAPNILKSCAAWTKTAKNYRCKEIVTWLTNQQAQIYRLSKRFPPELATLIVTYLP
jgi:hypothetical protein